VSSGQGGKNGWKEPTKEQLRIGQSEFLLPLVLPFCPFPSYVECEIFSFLIRSHSSLSVLLFLSLQLCKWMWEEQRESELDLFWSNGMGSVGLVFAVQWARAATMKYKRGVVGTSREHDRSVSLSVASYTIKEREEENLYFSRMLRCTSHWFLSHASWEEWGGEVSDRSKIRISSSHVCLLMRLIAPCPASLKLGVLIISPERWTIGTH